MMLSKQVKPRLTHSPGKALKEILSTLGSEKVIALCDENTVLHCLPRLHFNFTHTIILSPGEQEKSLIALEKVCNHLAHWSVSRNDLLVCIGGGVITDLGGFCASVYKRGIRFLHIPTTLLGMTDAALGGKTGINLNSLKNYIGSFSQPEAILCDPGMLHTLPPIEIKEGWAEIVKHALIADAELFETIAQKSALEIPEDHLLKQSMEIKLQIAERDPFEQNERRLLNFGHTLGHALESYFLSKNETLRHGTAVAAGMWMESWISKRTGLLSAKAMDDISLLLLNHFSFVPFNAVEIEGIVAYCSFDKKNENNQIKMTLLDSIGSARAGFTVSENLITEALHAYMLCRQ